MNIPADAEWEAARAIFERTKGKDLEDEPAAIRAIYRQIARDVLRRASAPLMAQAWREGFHACTMNAEPRGITVVVPPNPYEATRG